MVKNILIISFNLCFPGGRRKQAICFLLIKSETRTFMLPVEQWELYCVHITIITYNMNFLSEVLDGYDIGVCQREHSSWFYPDREIDCLLFYLKSCHMCWTMFRQGCEKSSAQCYCFFFFPPLQRSLHFHLEMNDNVDNSALSTLKYRSTWMYLLFASFSLDDKSVKKSLVCVWVCVCINWSDL